MTADDLRHRPSVNGITQPVVILTIPERDALADLIDAVRALLPGTTSPDRSYYRVTPEEWQRISATLAALDGDQ